MKVYVVGYEAKETDSVSFWDWYLLKTKAMDRIMELESNSELLGVIYHGVVEVNDDETDINGFIENYLEINDWENSF